MMKVYIVFFSTTGHVYKLAEAVADGAKSVSGVVVEVFRVAEEVSAPDQAGERNAAAALFTHVPIITAEELSVADAIIFGTPITLGMPAAPMLRLLDRTDTPRTQRGLVGKVGSVFTFAAAQDRNQESVLGSLYIRLLRLGMIIVGIPYNDRRLLSMEVISGRTAYGTSPIVGPDGIVQLSETEVGIARFQGQYVAETAGLLTRERAGTAKPR